MHVGIIDGGLNRSFAQESGVLIGSVSSFDICAERGMVLQLEGDRHDISDWIAGRNDFLDDLSGHGTAVTSIIWRLAPSTRISMAKILDEDGVANAWCLVEAMRWMVECVEPQLINISLATTNTEVAEELQSILDKAKKKNIRVFAAFRTDKDLPASLCNVYSIGDDDSPSAPRRRNLSKKSVMTTVSIWSDGKWIDCSRVPSCACAVAVGERCAADSAKGEPE